MKAIGDKPGLDAPYNIELSLDVLYKVYKSCFPKKGKANAHPILDKNALRVVRTPKSLVPDPPVCPVNLEV